MLGNSIGSSKLHIELCNSICNWICSGTLRIDLRNFDVKTDTCM